MLVRKGCFTGVGNVMNDAVVFVLPQTLMLVY